ncbi:TetR/AcrR family transcriptional regulator C-terminal domain-containing protein [Lysobacter niastensis]|uniref:TetR/AcrR family transcriptional regulator C-terminal domain-containing protein n=1 Tax=Lysobacter niastensis TaxID=380629 RepID=A0ABS0B8V5_9GAMM|nr:TetR/AcrR family transcriptional regulator C-terminal domain-containing protein [Lysobacter niastensis]MBF6025450.1 TetR/AcrR family transcriptional regulator C-terminal domain-containing protein [Lysobacter niastensis]
MLRSLARTFADDSGLSAIGRPFVRKTVPIACTPRTETIETNANGSPLSIPPATWLICFVPGLRHQWWHRFADTRHKHVFALRPLGDGTWLLVEPWWTRMMVSVLTLDEAVRFLRWGAMGDILRVRESIPGRGSQFRGWANCSVLVSFLLGRSYWTWTPNGLYRKLLAEPDVKALDLACFLKTHLLEEVGKHENVALKAIPARRHEQLEEVLLELGTALVTAMVSPPAVGLHKAAISECVRFDRAVAAYWASGPERAAARIRKILLDARQRGEIGFDDCRTAARRFLAMLQGNFHMEIVFGLRAAPCAKEVRDHVTFAVAVFLRGAHPPGASRENTTRCRSLTDGNAAPVAQGLIREVGESIREIVRGDDWESVADWAETVWSDYVACTGLTWEQASGRIRRAWESCSAASSCSSPG